MALRKKIIMNIPIILVNWFGDFDFFFFFFWCAFYHIIGRSVLVYILSITYLHPFFWRSQHQFQWETVINCTIYESIFCRYKRTDRLKSTKPRDASFFLLLFVCFWKKKSSKMWSVYVRASFTSSFSVFNC